VLSEANVTVVATGAVAERVTVAVEFAPPETELGLSVMLATDGTAVIVRVAVGAAPLSVAVIVDDPAVSVVVVDTVNVPVVEPAATVTVPGTVASVVLLDVKATEVPPVGAATLRVTVPVEVVPPRAGWAQRDSCCNDRSHCQGSCLGDSIGSCRDRRGCARVGVESGDREGCRGCACSDRDRSTDRCHGSVAGCQRDYLAARASWDVEVDRTS